MQFYTWKLTISFSSLAFITLSVISTITTSLFHTSRSWIISFHSCTPIALRSPTRFASGSSPFRFPFHNSLNGFFFSLCVSTTVSFGLLCSRQLALDWFHPAILYWTIFSVYLLWYYLLVHIGIIHHSMFPNILDFVFFVLWIMIMQRKFFPPSLIIHLSLATNFWYWIVVRLKL